MITKAVRCVGADSKPTHISESMSVRCSGYFEVRESKTCAEGGSSPGADEGELTRDRVELSPYSDVALFPRLKSKQSG